MAAQANPNVQPAERQLADLQVAAEEAKKLLAVGEKKQEPGAQSSEESKAEKSLVAAATAALVPFGGKLTFGAITGYCAGYASKKISKAAAMVVGTGFIALQILAYNGYVTVNWKKVEDDVMKKLDANGDGVVDAKDLQPFFKKTMSALQYNMPSSTGFVTGYVLGLKYA
eukprot:m.227992 g.227992  ORF g.227992 m.227992 type:complete len:170 (+) comp17374_c0_seq1:21-530(+)